MLCREHWSITFACTRKVQLIKDEADDRPRLCVLTRIGGAPDDQQSLIRLTVYFNEFQIEGLLTTAPSIAGEVAGRRPDLIGEIVTEYGSVRNNLTRRADGWPRFEACV